MLLRALVLAAVLASAPALAETAVPPLRAPVTDLTGTLTAAERASLEGTLRDLEERKGVQLAVLLVPTTGSETIEDYAMRVVETWKLGRGEVDDGVLFLVAKDDRQMRIEVGYGLEGALPDAIAKRIVRDVVTPYFRRGQFHPGIVAGVEGIVRVVEGEPLPRPGPESDLQEPGPGSLVLLLLAGSLVVGGVLRAMFGRLGGALVAGTGAGVLVWLTAGAIAMAVVAALLAFFLTLLGPASRGGGRRRRAWGGAPFPIPRGGGFGSRGGGWSGGGGRFGGGGASGRW